MIKITDEIREQVLDYLGLDDGFTDYPDDFYSFYYRCFVADVHHADADRYAILNTLLSYDIGMDNARAIDGWMYEHDHEIYELGIDEYSKALVMKSVEELKLNIDFNNWITEDYEYYNFFEE